MQVNRINVQNSYINFKGGVATSSSGFAIPSVVSQPVAEPPKKSLHARFVDACHYINYKMTPPFTEEEIRIANTTGELPERYCVMVNSNRTQVMNLCGLYDLAATRDKKLIKFCLPDSKFLSKLPDGYIIARQKTGNYCKLMKANKNLSSSWEVLA